MEFERNEETTHDDLQEAVNAFALCTIYFAAPGTAMVAACRSPVVVC